MDADVPKALPGEPLEERALQSPKHLGDLIFVEPVPTLRQWYQYLPTPSDILNDSFIDGSEFVFTSPQKMDTYWYHYPLIAESSRTTL